MRIDAYKIDYNGEKYTLTYRDLSLSIVFKTLKETTDYIRINKNREDEREIISTIQGIEQNTNRMNCILKTKFDFNVTYRADIYDQCNGSREREKTYLYELTIGIENLTLQLRTLLERL